jgi:hypothetical protein
MQELDEAVGYQPCERLQAKNFLQRMEDEPPSLEGRGMQVIYPHTFHIHRSGIRVATTHEQGTPLGTTCQSFRMVAFCLGELRNTGF